MGVTAKFTIQRISNPTSRNRFSGTNNAGEKVWTTAGADFDVFDSRRAAAAYRAFCMGEHALDCRVVRHSVH